MNSIVFDSSAVLALLRGEPGNDVVKERMEKAAISAVNFSEVISRLIDYGHSPDEADSDASALGLQVVPFDAAAALRSGILRAETRKAGLSLGDRACLELAERLGLPVLTGDRAWAALDVGVEVVLIR